jgi:hypothetical protein
VSLPSIPDEKRKDASGLWKRFNDASPRIFGAFLDVVVTGLKNLPVTEPSEMSRMADFNKWIVACEPALPWKPGNFVEMYRANQGIGREIAYENSVVARAVEVWFVALEQDEWSGTATELLGQLSNEQFERFRCNKRWPAQPNALSGALRREGSALAARGIEVTFTQKPVGKKRERLIQIRKNNEVRDDEGCAMVINAPTTLGKSEEWEKHSVITSMYGEGKYRENPSLTTDQPLIPLTILPTEEWMTEEWAIAAFKSGALKPAKE